MHQSLRLPHIAGMAVAYRPCAWGMRQACRRSFHLCSQSVAKPQRSLHRRNFTLRHFAAIAAVLENRMTQASTVPDKPTLDQPALDQLFLQARTYNAFSGEIDDATLHRLYDLLKFGPSTANSTPARFVFVRSQAAKQRLGPALDEGN
jgi:3-hydroxypropanoate dehydrogenase